MCGARGQARAGSSCVHAVRSANLRIPVSRAACMHPEGASASLGGGQTGTTLPFTISGIHLAQRLRALCDHLKFMSR